MVERALYWDRRVKRISGELTWEVACPPRWACSRAISAASSSVRLSEVSGSLRCSNSSLTRAWREPQDADTTLPPSRLSVQV